MSTSIGTVTKTSNGGYTGTLSTMSINAGITFVPVDNPRDKAPNFRIYTTNRFELGAAWIKENGEGKEYVSCKFSSPELPGGTLYANLGQAPDQDDEDIFSLIWNPPVARV